MPSGAGGGRGDGGLRVGLGDGRVMPLSVGDSRIRRSLKLDDVVLVPDGLALPSALAVVHDGPTALRIVRLVGVRDRKSVV